MVLKVNAKELRNMGNVIVDYQSKMEDIEQRICNIQNLLYIRVDKQPLMQKQIRAILIELDKEKNSVKAMGTTLEKVAMLYENAEKKIAGDALKNTIGNKENENAGKGADAEWQEKVVDAIATMSNLSSKNIWEIAKDIVILLATGGISVGLSKVYQYIKELLKGDTDFTNHIKDLGTRKGLDNQPQYRDILEEIYNRASGNVKDLYDKYAAEVVIASFTARSSYHSAGKLYMDMAGDINNLRGNGTTYYHEYGHFIVNQNKWVSGGKLSPEFSEYDKAIRKDVDNYISSLEDQAREKYKDTYSGTALENQIEKETKSKLKSVFGGVNANVYNGASDIIDGGTNGKYEPTYGHNDTYWEDNTTRLANESFAQMFSAEITGDTAETKFMKEIFPNAYAEYEKLKKSAINKK